jgi:hypothetical protein
LTIVTQGPEFASIEARSMIAGAGAFVIYGITCVYLMGVRRTKASRAALSALSIWVVCALGLWALFLR